MTPRPVDSIGAAFRQWAERLFSPFSFKKWAWWTLVAMGAGLGGGGGGGGNIPAPGSWKRNESLEDLGLPSLADLDIPGFLMEQLAAVVAIAAALALLVLVFMYFAAVLRFVFLDNIVRNEAAIIRPFLEYHREGFSYFGYMILFALAVLALAAVPAVFLVMGIAGSSGMGAKIGGVILLVLWILAVVLVAALVDVFTYDFVLPAMYLRRTGVLEGFRAAWSGLAAPFPMQTLGYLGMKILLMIGLSIPVMIAAILAMLFYIAASLIVLVPLGFLVYALGWSWQWLWLLVPLGTLWLFGLLFAAALCTMPLAAFSRCYSLSFLEGLGAEWRTLSPAPAPEPAPAGSS